MKLRSIFNRMIGEVDDKRKNSTLSKKALRLSIGSAAGEPEKDSEEEARSLKSTTLDFMGKWFRNPITQDKLVSTLPKRFNKDDVSSEVEDKLKEISNVKYMFSSALPSGTAGNFDINEGIKINRNLLNMGNEKINNPATTSLHEAVHSTNFDNLYGKIAPKMKVGNLPENEIYPRIMELRKALGINPGDEITEEQIEGLKFEGMMEGEKMYPSFLYDLLKEYDVNEIIKMNKDWAGNKVRKNIKNRVPVQSLDFT